MQFAGSVLFYRDPANHPGWRRVTDSEDMLIFASDGRRMSLLVNDDSAIFALHSGQ